MGAFLTTSQMCILCANSPCNTTAEDGNGFLIDVSCILVNARPLFVLSFMHLSGSPLWTVLCSFWDAVAVANKQ